jgi:F-type H+-transporting ATPase subunit gamma
MPSLKDLRNRIRSVKSTQKITTAMKLVAAAKLRRAQEQAEAARPYAERLNNIIGALGSRLADGGDAPKLLTGSGADKTHLVIVATSDRGLCGAFNASILREARALLRQLNQENKSIQLMCLGRRGRDGLRREYGQLMIDAPDVMGKRRIAFSDADQVANQVRRLFEGGSVDVVTIVYARFKSAISQVITRRQLIPAPMPEQSAAVKQTAMVEYEPDEETILAALLPRNLSVQIYGALLENAASEHGARMTAMDNATRNAGDMINRLTLNYNRTRQAVITKELIEIISGAEAV